MKWLDPKALLFKLLIVWLLILSAYILVLEIVLTLIRYWYFALLVLALIVGIWILVCGIRRRLDRW